ncbi:MAG: hypothetical protein MJ188_11830 [Treponema sp.]|nr:hypothetical protein [Treponema sp.]
MEGRQTDIIGYRCYNPGVKTNYEKQMKELKESWKLEQKEQVFDADLEYFNSLF